MNKVSEIIRKRYLNYYTYEDFIKDYKEVQKKRCYKNNRINKIRYRILDSIFDKIKSIVK